MLKISFLLNARVLAGCVRHLEKMKFPVECHLPTDVAIASDSDTSRILVKMVKEKDKAMLDMLKNDPRPKDAQGIESLCKKCLWIGLSDIVLKTSKMSSKILFYYNELGLNFESKEVYNFFSMIRENNSQKIKDVDKPFQHLSIDMQGAVVIRLYGLIKLKELLSFYKIDEPLHLAHELIKVLEYKFGSKIYFSKSLFNSDISYMINKKTF